MTSLWVVAVGALVCAMAFFRYKRKMATAPGRVNPSASGGLPPPPPPTAYRSDLARVECERQFRAAGIYKIGPIEVRDVCANKGCDAQGKLIKKGVNELGGYFGIDVPKDACG